MTGVVQASVEKRRRSREFVEFLKRLDAVYAPETAIKIILDRQPVGRFTFVFTPKRGSWLNLVEGLFFKLARSALRHIRVASREELRQRILPAINLANREPVVYSWTHKIENSA